MVFDFANISQFFEIVSVRLFGQGLNVLMRKILSASSVFVSLAFSTLGLIRSFSKHVCMDLFSSLLEYPLRMK